jgi:hypothetical protein
LLKFFSVIQLPPVDGNEEGTHVRNTGGLEVRRRTDVSRATTRAHQRARARRSAWTLTALVATGPLVALLWPVKSLFYYVPKWYVELILGL